jgi:putative flippase GtrA
MPATTNFLALTPVRFVLVGVLNTLTGLGVIYVLKLLLSMNDVAANFVGYGVGLLIGYVLNARWTFSFRGPLSAAAWRFALLIVVAYLTNLAAVGVALRLFDWNGYFAQAAGVLPYAAVTYFGAKYLVFRAARAVPVRHDGCDAAASDSGITQNRKRDARA